MKKENIVLIGMPGAGKSTVGVVLAKSAGLQFVDTDLLIQQKTGQCLQAIIDFEGIDRFLQIEEEVVSALSCSGCVIATGGSVVFSEKAMRRLSENGVIVFLDVPLEEIRKRVGNIKTRGIAMTPGKGLDSVYEERLPLYRSYAELTVPAAGDSLENTVETVLHQLI